MEILVMIHSLWRWLVLATAVLAVIGAAAAPSSRGSGWTGRSGGRKGWAARTGLVYTVALDVQVLTGLVLWVWRQSWQGLPFFAYTHPVLMLLASALAHMGRRRERREGNPRAGVLYYVASLALLLVGIPWPR